MKNLELRGRLSFAHSNKIVTAAGQPPGRLRAGARVVAPMLWVARHGPLILVAVGQNDSNYPFLTTQGLAIDCPFLQPAPRAPARTAPRATAARSGEIISISSVKTLMYKWF